VPGAWRPDGELLELTLVAPTLPELYAQLAAAWEQVLPAGPGADEERVPLLVRGTGASELLAGFVDDVLDLAAADGFAIRRLDRLRLGESWLRAAVSGLAPCPPARWSRRAAELRQGTAGWAATIAIAGA
jgi:hypothetical protein